MNSLHSKNYSSLNELDFIILKREESSNSSPSESFKINLSNELYNFILNKNLFIQNKLYLSNQYNEFYFNKDKSLNHNSIKSFATVSSDLNFNNPTSLLRSLDEKPDQRWLRKIYEREDEKALKFFLREKNFQTNEFNKGKLELLWECCQIPDFVKKTYGNHYEVIENVFKFLSSSKSKITNEFMQLEKIAFLCSGCRYEHLSCSSLE